MKRRAFIELGAIAGAGLLIDGTSALAAQGSSRRPGATVKTTGGLLRGHIDNNVHVFKGVPYGASTAGANRFMPPQKLKPWTDVRDAVEWGGRAPAVVGGEPAEMIPTDPREAQSEDCLMLN